MALAVTAVLTVTALMELSTQMYKIRLCILFFHVELVINVVCVFY